MSLKIILASLTLAAVAVNLTPADEKKSETKKSAAEPLQPQMTPEGGWDQTMGTLGEKPAQPWTDTTIGAGVDKKPLNGKIVTVTGEIINLPAIFNSASTARSTKLAVRNASPMASPSACLQNKAASIF